MPPGSRSGIRLTDCLPGFFSFSLSWRYPSPSSVLDTLGAHTGAAGPFLGATFNVLMGAVELVFVASDLVTFLLPGS